jgi:precorrin-6Y C5,15-methyltransferase (decarboxylating)
VSRIVIFSGTTEGRKLSEMLSAAGISHDVCVATEYGADVMEPDSYARVNVGRMDSEQMYEFMTECKMGKGDHVIDATHPYATEVTENIRTATDRTGAEYIRIIRKSGVPDGDKITCYDDIGAVAEALCHTEGNVLLTTGSKELHAYHKNSSEELFGRTYVRVLPTKDSLDICLAEGVDPRRIIAAVGPFSKEMNRAVIRQYDIRHLITKESGSEGDSAIRLMQPQSLAHSVMS